MEEASQYAFTIDNDEGGSAPKGSAEKAKEAEMLKYTLLNFAEDVMKTAGEPLDYNELGIIPRPTLKTTMDSKINE